MKLWCSVSNLLLSATVLAQSPAPKGVEPSSPTEAAPTAVSKTPAAAKAEKKGKGKKEIVPPPLQLKVAKPLPHCSTYSATPLDSPFLQYEKKIYVTSPKLPSDTSAASNYLIEIDLTTNKSKRLAGFKSGPFVSLVAHDKVPKSISILDFSKGKPECGEGLTSGMAININEQKVSSSFPSANYGYVPGDIFSNLSDLDRGLIQALDISTGQRRSLEVFTLGTRPLYLKVSPPLALYAYNPDSRELAKYVANKKSPNAKLKLKEGMRLVRDGDKFGVAEIKDNKLQILQLKDWSGNDTKTTEFDLPVEFASANPSVKVRFKDDEALVFGKDEASKKSLASVIYAKGKDVKTFRAPDQKSYFSEAGFGLDGSVTLLLSELDSDVLQEVWIAKGPGEPTKIDVLKGKKPVVTPTKMK